MTHFYPNVNQSGCWIKIPQTTTFLTKPYLVTLFCLIMPWCSAAVLPPLTAEPPFDGFDEATEEVSPEAEAMEELCCCCDGSCRVESLLVTLAMYGTGIDPVCPNEFRAVHHCSSSLDTTVMTSPLRNGKSSGSLRQNGKIHS